MTFTPLPPNRRYSTKASRLARPQGPHAIAQWACPLGKPGGVCSVLETLEIRYQRGENAW